MHQLTPELVLSAYAQGIFPMAMSAQATRLHWFDPERRGILPLDGFHVSRSLTRTRRRGNFRFSCDTAFGAVLSGCGDRRETWINPPIVEVFHQLQALGHAHSIEIWEGTDLAGGVYGLAMGGAFFAESMFSRRADGSKLALAELVARLRLGGFMLLDTQYLTPHLASLGGKEVPRRQYRRLLAEALAHKAESARAFAPINPERPDGAFWLPPGA